MSFQFQKLIVYQKAKAFHLRVTELLVESEEIKKHYRDQLGRASLSVILNIAEGSSRFTTPSRKNFLVIARGSLFECVAALEMLSDQDMISQQLYSDLKVLADELSRILFKMIKNLER